MSWQNVNVPTVDEAQITFPFVQWINNGASLDPRRPRGGFGQPEEQMQLAGHYPKGSQMHNLILKSGESVLVAFTHTLRAAVLTTRFAWIKDGKRIPTYVEGARSKLQALAIIEGEEGPFIATLTFSGMAGKEFNDALKRHKERVRRLTSAVGAVKPASIFYATYTASEPKMVGRTAKSQITPVVLSDEDTFDLDSAYVGDEALSLVDWDQVKAWKEAWKTPGPNGDGEISGSEDEEDKPKAGDEKPKPKPKNPNALASDAQWGLIRKLMAKIGIEGRDKQDEMIAKAGYDPKALTMGQASELIGRLQAAKAKENGSSK